MKRFRIPTFWRAVLLIAAAYFVYDHAFPPVTPRSVMIEFMTITVIGVLLYFSFDDRRWAEFKAPILAVLREDGKWPARWALLILAPALGGYITYRAVAPSLEAPVELRQVHPAPPTTLRAYHKTYDLTSLENPVRSQVLLQLETDPAQAWKTYTAAVEKGRKVYYQNCFYCHGDLLDGRGMFARSLAPPPANFRDVGTIAQLQEAFLFWRITKGGPGLPKEGAPWNSAMPAWEEMLSEEEVWNVILFLYDQVGQVPRMWNQQVSKAVTAIKEQVQTRRAQLDGKGLYQFHCAVCHGENGAGDGLAAAFMYPKPRDFTLGLYKYKSSPFKTMPPTDEDLLHAIKNGLPGTAMPAWGTVLSDEQLRSLIPVVKGFDSAGTWAPKDAPDRDFDKEGRYTGKLVSIVQRIKTDNLIPFTEESVAKGKRAFEKTCAQCHGEDGRGNPAPDKRLRDDWGKRIWPRDLTKPWTWRVTEVADSSQETIRNIYVRLSVGIPGTPMPAHADKVSEEDRWHIANFVYTLRNYTPPLSASPVIRAVKVTTPLPDSVGDGAWASVPATGLLMLPNIIKGDRLFKPLSDSLALRVLYNDHEIAFLLELDDRTHSRPGDPEAEKTQDTDLKLYPDAFAIQFPQREAHATAPVVEKPMFRHGDAKHSTTIWYWNAGSVEPPMAPYLKVLNGNGVDQKLHPHPADAGLTASGDWANGRWRVMFKRKLQPAEVNDVVFAEGKFIPLSFANWDGSNGEAGSKHVLSAWYWLLLPPPVHPLYLYVLPLAIGLGIFGAGLWLARRGRARK